MKKKDYNSLGINLTQQKFAQSLQRVSIKRYLKNSFKVPQTFSKDGLLRFGDSILLKNQATDGTLVFDSGDKITSNDEAYGCTTTDKAVGPCSRSILQLSKAEDDGAKDNLLRFGQKVRFESTVHLVGKKLYLHST